MRGSGIGPRQATHDFRRIGCHAGRVTLPDYKPVGRITVMLPVSSLLCETVSPGTPRTVFRGLASRFLMPMNGAPSLTFEEVGTSCTSDIGSSGYANRHNVSHQREPVNPACSEIILGILSRRCFFRIFLPPFYALWRAEDLPAGKDEGNDLVDGFTRKFAKTQPTLRTWQISNLTRTVVTR